MTVTARDAATEWAWRHARGELEGLGWASLSLDPRTPPFSREGDDASPRFHHLPYAALLPPPMAEAARSARSRGEPTLMDGWLLAFAWIEWVLANRDRLLTAQTPVPGLLEVVLESHGVGRELHEGDPNRIRGLYVVLLAGTAQRGTLAWAQALLEAAGREASLGRSVDLATAGSDPLTHDLSTELFCCRSEGWWAIHHSADGPVHLRIEGGMLRFQPRRANAWSLRGGDLLLGEGDDALEVQAWARLLPVWTCPRIARHEEGGE